MIEKAVMLIALATLTSCAGFWESAGVVAADPQVQDGIVETIENVASGNWVGAVLALGGVAGTIATRKLWQRVKDSGPGEVIGSSVPQARP